MLLWRIEENDLSLFCWIWRAVALMLWAFRHNKCFYEEIWKIILLSNTQPHAHCRDTHVYSFK